MELEHVGTGKARQGKKEQGSEVTGGHSKRSGQKRKFSAKR
jgi:hypothetical protein